MVFLLYHAVFYVVCCISEELPASISSVLQNLNINSLTRYHFVFLFTAVFLSFSGTLNPFQDLNYPARPLNFYCLSVTLRNTRFNIQKFRMVITLHLFVLYGSQKKQ
jgi:hypothetical protein